MKELELKYGCNPNQKPSKIYMKNGKDLPIQVLNGRPGYINFLDAFNGWQSVSLRKLQDFRLQHHLSMYHLQELQWDFRLMRHWLRFTG